MTGSCSGLSSTLNVGGFDDASSSGYLSFSDVLKRKPSLADSRAIEYASSESSDESDWDENEWPSSNPLPLPLWGCERPELVFETVAEYEKFQVILTEYLQECIATLPYDTLSTFMQ